MRYLRAHRTMPRGRFRRTSSPSCRIRSLILGDAQFYRGLLRDARQAPRQRNPSDAAPARRASFSTRRSLWAAHRARDAAAETQLRMPRQPGTARPLACLSAFETDAMRAGAGMDTAQRSERKAALEDSDRRSLIQIHRRRIASPGTRPALRLSVIFAQSTRR